MITVDFPNLTCMDAEGRLFVEVGRQAMRVQHLV